MPPPEKRQLSPLEVASCKTGRRLGMIRHAPGAYSKKRIIVAEGSACYHVMSRTTGGDFLLDPQCKEAFVIMMRRMEEFCGLEVLTYCVLDNHFHILARVPDREKWLKRFDDTQGKNHPGGEGEERLLKHLKTLYSKVFIQQVRSELAFWRSQKREDAAQELLQKFKDRMCNIVTFTKELKARFSRWYNKQYERRGTLWMERFKSLLVEDGKALRTMAAYIDLNPVRAKIAAEKSPESYRWSGYGEAIGEKNHRKSRHGIREIMQAGDRRFTIAEALEKYRNTLILDGSLNDLKEETSKEKLEQNTLRPLNALKCRIRYLTEGQVLGQASFVEHIFAAHRSLFGKTRKTGAKPLPDFESKGLFSLKS